MDQPSLYDDIVTWAEQQAQAVRALARRPELSSALDWENVAEEIESVGRSQTDAVETALLETLVHVFKDFSSCTAPSTGRWRVEEIAQHAIARKRYRSAMHQRVEWDALWPLALKLAGASLQLNGERLAPGLPHTMPFTPEELVSDTFEMDWALRLLADTLKRADGGH